MGMTGSQLRIAAKFLRQLLQTFLLKTDETFSAVWWYRMCIECKNVSID